MPGELKITLEAARVRAGYSLDEAAEKLGITRQTLRSYEADCSKAKAGVLMSAVELYRYPLDLIYFGDADDFAEKVRHGT
jgi:DNA-binding XRE family transcriptional regulator